MEYSFITTPYRIDRKLYKYFSNVKYAIDSIRGRHIHLDNPQDFNDPFDATVGLFQYTTMREYDTPSEVMKNIIRYTTNSTHTPQVQHYLKKMVTLYQEKYEQLQIQAEDRISTIVSRFYKELDDKKYSFEQFCKMVDNGYAKHDGFVRLDCKISCFSEVWDSILMWSYYANSHRGVCVEYDLSKLNTDNTLNNKIINSIAKVQYSPIRTDLLPATDEANQTNFIMSKSDVWSHEYEWRIVCESEQEYLPFDCISKVYLGVGFDTNAPKYQDLVRAVATHDDVDISKCQLNQDRYQIDAERCYDGLLMSQLKRNKELLA